MQTHAAMSQSDGGATSIHPLIGSDRVEGTAVTRPNGERIGTIKRLMIDKQSGQVACAVMTFGGFLGFGEKEYELPWSSLKYNPQLASYALDISDQELRGVSEFEEYYEKVRPDRKWDDYLDRDYTLPRYWGM